MTSAVEQAGNEHPVGFHPHREGLRSLSHTSQFWYRTKSHPGNVSIISSSESPMGVSTPPPQQARGALKLDIFAGSSKEMTHELPHWMDSKRGLTPPPPATRPEIVPEAGPSTPMKCPPRQLVEPPNPLLQFSSPAGSYVALFEPRSKVTWARQEQIPILPSGENYPVHVSSSRGGDQSGLQRESVQVQKESQKENVMSLKELKSALHMLSSSKGVTPPSTGSSAIGQPALIRALATLAESKSKTIHSDDSILQLHLRHEPCGRSPVTSPEKHSGDRRARNDMVGCDRMSHGVKQEALSGNDPGMDCDGWRMTRSGSMPSANEFAHPQPHESARSTISSTRLFQQRRQAGLESEGSLDLHADLSLGLQSATESTHHAMWHGGDCPSKLLEQKWSEIHSPKVDSRLIVNSSQRRSTNSTPSAPQTPAVSLSLFHLMPSATVVREELRGQSRTDNERIGALKDGTTAVGKKRKQFRKVHKTADYSPGVSSSVELNNPAEYADLRDEIKKRVKRETSEVVVVTNQENKEDRYAEGTPFQLWLPTTETASHPKKHDFFPDKRRYADAKVPPATQESPLGKARICGTSSPPLFKESTDFSHERLVYQNGIVNDNASAGSFNSSAPSTVQHSVSYLTPKQLSIATEMLEETQLGLGRPSATINPSKAVSVRSLPTGLKHLGERGEEVSTPDISWQQRSKLFTVPAHAPMPIGHPTFSAGEPSLPLSLSCFAEPARNPPQTKNSQATTPKPEEEWGKSLALCATPVAAVPPHQSSSAPALNYQERFVLLQAYLKHCDEVGMSQNIQALRKLSPAARSGVAVELESKAMWLSIEEGLEMRRLNSINVMGWNMGNGAQPLQGDDGATPRGRRLPVPGEMRPSPPFFAQPRVPHGLLSVGQTPSPYS